MSLNMNETMQGVEELMSEGLRASKSNDSGRAIDLWTQAAALSPSSGMLHFLIGSEWAATGRFDHAEAEFANAVLLDSSLLVARYQLGLIQFSSGRAAVALLTWEALLQEDTSKQDAKALAAFVRGHAALAQDDFAQALDQYQLGLDCSVSNPALAGDIRKMMLRIAELGKVSSAAAQAPTDASKDSEQEASHVLLSNYVQQSKPH
jgi:tetratricopeptide (TPR) repeat protein